MTLEHTLDVYMFVCVRHDHESDGVCVWGGGSSREYEEVKSINCLYDHDFVINTDCICECVGVVIELYV